ncbi:MAG: c-type cytochrome [Pikeienuella sp.]|uniref:c-type cytochrome n=1 Tax=Pikeienuella sp. TaxID=2831957 RepID=UPI00391B2BCB
MNRARRLAPAVAIAGVAGAAFLAIRGPAAPDVTRGASLYAEHCASCHGAGLEGEAEWRNPNPDGSLRAPPHDDSGHTWHHGDRLLFDYVRLGGAETLRRMDVGGVVSGMPAFGDILSDAEIRDVLAFIRASWSPEMRAFQAARTEDEVR